MSRKSCKQTRKVNRVINHKIVSRALPKLVIKLTKIKLRINQLIISKLLSKINRSRRPRSPPASKVKIKIKIRLHNKRINRTNRRVNKTACKGQTIRSLWMRYQRISMSTPMFHQHRCLQKLRVRLFRQCNTYHRLHSRTRATIRTGSNVHTPQNASSRYCSKQWIVSNDVSNVKNSFPSNSECWWLSACWRLL